MKKDCTKFKKWLENKGNSISCVCYESNMVDVNHNTWWTYSASIIHLSNTLQGMRNLRNLVGSEHNVLSSNKVGSYMESIGTCSLVLDNGYVLDLKWSFYIPIFSRNLISTSRLIPLGYSFKFSDCTFSLFCKYELIRKGILSNDVFFINLQYNAVLHTHIGNKRCIMNEDSSILLHQRLGHIFIDRIKRLVNEKVLNTLDFIDFDTCIDCIKGKQTNKFKKGAKRSTDVLEIIYSDICCPNMDAHGPKYFISFIDDCS